MDIYFITLLKFSATVWLHINRSKSNIYLAKQSTYGKETAMTLNSTHKNNAGGRDFSLWNGDKHEHAWRLNISDPWVIFKQLSVLCIRDRHAVCLPRVAHFQVSSPVMIQIPRVSESTRSSELPVSQGDIHSHQLSRLRIIFTEHVTKHIHLV